jgi:hypothetical protein
MLNKEAILDHLRNLTNRYRVSRKELQVLGGAALVLHGLRTHAEDIDIYLHFETCEKLLETGEFQQEPLDKECKIWIKNEIFDIQNNYYPCEKSKEGFMIQTQESLLRMKSSLNREKDKPDIERLQLALGQY